MHKRLTQRHGGDKLLVVLVALMMSYKHNVCGWSTTGLKTLFSRREPRLRNVVTAARLFSNSETIPIVSDKLWQGASHPSSEFVTHVIAGPDHFTVEQAIESCVVGIAKNKSNTRNIPRDNRDLTAMHLLRLGSVWFLSRDSPRNPNQGTKPTRLTADNSTTILNEGDYLRIHQSPRRFPAVYDYSWNESSQTLANTKPSVIVARNDEKGYLVIDKPARVPVHATVDNCLENVAQCIRDGGNNPEYVSTPQRLDQNTSGLLVVSTSKPFAAYYANLLRIKTDQQLNDNVPTSSQSAIHKRYKCLVCLKPNSNQTVAKERDRLAAYASSDTIMRHYLEPSIRAPKHFARVPGNESWPECLLRIVGVGDLYPLVGSDAGQELANELWDNRENMPHGCVAVVELQVELLTGRTHQIRGQLSTEGFPLVGDVQYGGAKSESSIAYGTCEKLALQCTQLEFLDPDVRINHEDGTEEAGMIISNRWNSFELKEAWWTSHLDRFHLQTKSDTSVTTSTDDQQLVKALEDVELPGRGEHEEEPNRVVPRVQLEPGVHKYVLIRAKKRNTQNGNSQTHWFVKSASPLSCGGAYHANVAQDLVQELVDSDYDSVVVTGGGRIDYDDKTPHAHVYGFSYGFGKGDHALAAQVIERETTIIATYDNKDGLY